MGRLPANFPSDIRTPKCSDILQTQHRELIGGQNFFALQAFCLRFERRAIPRFFKRDMLKKFVMRRANVRRI
jgi:hypothetical protein